jgi:hypothetical protein
VGIGGNAPTIIRHRNGTIGIYLNFNVRAMPCQCFINGIIDHLIDQMM